MNDTFDLASDPGFDHLPGAMIVYDAGGRVVRASRAALDILGFVSEQEIVGTSAAQAGWFRTDPAGWPEAETLHPAMVAIRGGKPERGVVARGAKPPGDDVWVQVDAVPNGGEGVGAVIGVTGVLQDTRLPPAPYGDASPAPVAQ